MAVDPPSSGRRVMVRVERWIGRHTFAVVVAGLFLMAVYATAQIAVEQVRLFDWIGLTSIPAAVAAFLVAMSFPVRAERTLTQLANRRVLKLSIEELDGLRADVARRTSRSARFGSLIGLLVILLIAVPFIAYFGSRIGQTWKAEDPLRFAVKETQVVVALLAVLLIGCLGGYYVGYAISVGRWATLLRRRGEALSVRPGHPDGAAGWGPLGELYLFQALALAIAALYYAVWVVLIRLNVGQFHDAYGTVFRPYLVFCLLLLGAEIIAFVAPVWSFHLEMRRQRMALASETDQLSDRIVTLQGRIVQTDDPDEAVKLTQQLAAMTRQYQALANMPTWPVKTSVAVRFVLGNLGLLAPLLVQALRQGHP